MDDQGAAETDGSNVVAVGARVKGGRGAQARQALPVLRWTEAERCAPRENKVVYIELQQLGVPACGLLSKDSSSLSGQAVASYARLAAYSLIGPRTRRWSARGPKRGWAVPLRRDAFLLSLACRVIV